MAKYQIEVSEEQLDTLIKATELLARVGIGQVSEAVGYSPAALIPNVGDLASARQVAREVESLCTGMPPDASFGIGHEKVAKITKRSWELYQTLRHRLSWDRAGNPEKRDYAKMFGAHYDEPMNYTGEPLPVIRKMES